MINIVIPLAGKSSFFKEDEIIFPKPFTEICGKTMIEMLIENYEVFQEKRNRPAGRVIQRPSECGTDSGT